MASGNQDTQKMDIEEQTKPIDPTDQYLKDIEGLTDQEIQKRIQIYKDNMRAYIRESSQLARETEDVQAQMNEGEKRLNEIKVLPYLVSNVTEILNIEPEEDENDAVDEDAKMKSTAVVIKTSNRQTIFCPKTGFLDPSELKTGEIIGVNKDTFLLYEKLPTDYDARVQKMEVDEKPSEDYQDIGGLDKQIEELREAIVLPITHADKFKAIGIRPPKGCLMFGPPGTGKTMLARACAAQTKATFLKLTGPSLVQMFIGDGAKMIRDAFALAKEKAPTIIFIDELDAIGTKRFDSDKNSDREVQRTMLELLNQLDGFSPNDDIKVIAATNRPDSLDPALLRSGRLDRKIEFPLPNEEAREQILRIHSRKMNVDPKVNFAEIARSTADFNGAQMKAVCVEAGMIALRRNASILNHEDYVEGIMAVQDKKKHDLNYFA
ncbi:P-loop containing nucleoside triphosphate hydrolase [Pseudocohnilembus persalinus]|uniref:p-loop containing nucleoside triphosphate hydrolase n=1 Tax=Pseudocohnilembus persalinus TaxID=266149 RepID=A0A0V0QZA4_PSEPJ|nr:P-loop containing nucleoside triphosphate hydrolase [Pseudocohnilembus persalinus]|eukprot:KRX07639.1 P-loop containing nucleoside triphosphate hydrolase [Pseudocohnilembus persalinus]